MEGRSPLEMGIAIILGTVFIIAVVCALSGALTMKPLSDNRAILLWRTALVTHPQNPSDLKAADAPVFTKAPAENEEEAIEIVEEGSGKSISSCDVVEETPCGWTVVSKYESEDGIVTPPDETQFVFDKAVYNPRTSIFPYPDKEVVELALNQVVYSEIREADDTFLVAEQIGEDNYAFVYDAFVSGPGNGSFWYHGDQPSLSLEKRTYYVDKATGKIVREDRVLAEEGIG